MTIVTLVKCFDTSHYLALFPYPPSAPGLVLEICAARVKPEVVGETL